MPVEVNQAWASLRARLDQPPRRRFRAPAAAAAATWRAFGRMRRETPPWVGWALAAQLLAVLFIAAPRPAASPPAIYHTLGAPPAPAPGNVVVIFRPDAREAEMRAALRETGARLVDGPTAADANVLHVPPSGRAAAVAALRRRPDIVLAEPVDAGDPP